MIKRYEVYHAGRVERVRFFLSPMIKGIKIEDVRTFYCTNDKKILKSFYFGKLASNWVIVALMIKSIKFLGW